MAWSAAQLAVQLAAQRAVGIGYDVASHMDEPPSAALVPADPADVDSIDGIVNALYASVSFQEGKHPDWDRFRSLFDPAALLVRIDARLAKLDPRERGESPVRISSLDEYVARTSAMVSSGVLTAFIERELTRRTDAFADLATVFSTYERSVAAGDYHRGINSLQLVKDGARWWLVSLTWTDELEHGTLPSRYLPRGP